MNLTDEQIKYMLELKESILQEIEKHQEETRRLEKNLDIFDSILKQSSFTKASSLPKSEPAVDTEEDAVPITRDGQGGVIASARVTPEQISITLHESLEIGEDIPPFKSFFLDRIIADMRKKDAADAAGTQNIAAIECIINKNGQNIRDIIIKNYRRKERVGEIIDSARWSLNKMLDNTR